MPLVLSKDQADRLRNWCAGAEARGALTPAILELAYKQKWFKLFVPKALGGLELNLPEALQYEEYLAYIDGSLGWTVTLCAGANLFCGYIQKKKAYTIFSKEKVCFGGSGAAGGVAREVKGGYIVNGYWKYATGAPHLTHFTANCVIEKDGKALLKEDGTPLTRSFFFNKNEVIVHKDWNTMGLKATAGHSFSVQDIKVSNDRSFIIDGSHTTLEGNIYKYPFLPFAEATIAVNTLGMTRHFLEEALYIIQQKKRQHARQGHAANRIAEIAIVSAQQKVYDLSDRFYTITDISWKELEHKHVSKKSVNKIAALSRLMVKECRQQVATIYPYCGLAATNNGTVINRAFRDIFTGSQHGLLTFSK
ncbi:acyl-CoA dehydrogenase family protein [Niabella aquatica]